MDKTVTVKNKATVIIPIDVVKKIQYVCSRISHVEWSGQLFYKVLEGTLKDPSTLKVKVVDLHVQDRGSAAYTESETDIDILDLYDEKPELEDCRTGFIHSHNSMGVYFSTTDIDELKINHAKTEMYLSVIVNNRTDICAKIAYAGTEVRKKIIREKAVVSFKYLNEVISNEDPERNEIEDTTNKIMFTIDCDIEAEISPDIDDPFFVKTVDEVIRNSTRIGFKQNGGSTYNNRNNSGFDKTWDYDYTRKGYDEWDDWDTRRSVSSGHMNKEDTSKEKEDVRDFVDIQSFMTTWLSQGLSESSINFKTTNEIFEYLFKANNENLVERFVNRTVMRFDMILDTVFNNPTSQDKLDLTEMVMNELTDISSKNVYYADICEKIINRLEEMLETNNP